MCIRDSITGYRQRYFSPEKSNGHVVYSWALKEGAEDAIYNKISDICVSMSADDYLEMPDLIENDIRIQLEEGALKKYKELEREKLLEIDDNEITAMTAAAVYNKLLQMANGGVYDDEGNTIEIHDQKIEALKEIVDTANGQAVLVFYNYRHDFHRLMTAFCGMHPRTIQTQTDIQAWNRGRCV